jgi:hypothetical protein
MGREITRAEAHSIPKNPIDWGYGLTVVLPLREGLPRVALW